MIKTYFQARMEALGITEEINRTPILDVQIFPDRKLKPFPDQYYPFFDEQIYKKEVSGNIDIHYFTEEGLPVVWKRSGTTSIKHFVRTRLRTPIEDNKYSQLKGSGHYPFMTPRVIAAYQAGTEIDTLVFTEGEFKAFKGDMAGAYIIGLPSIHGFYSGEVRGEIQHGITRVILKCKVKNIILLHDADALTVNWAKGKELSKRPASFISSVTNFREALEPLMGGEDLRPLKNVYYYTIRTKLISEDAKGLDDLLCKFPAKEKDIISDLLTSSGTPSEFFEGTMLTNYGNVSKKLRHKFGLNGDQDDFYKAYKEYIGNNIFVYKGRRYAWTGEKLEYQGHDDAEYYVRIGPDWFKKVKRPLFINGKWSDTEKLEDLEKWKVGEISRDYKRFPDFFDQLGKFDGFTSIPEWDNNRYQRRIGDFFNIVNPIIWTPKEGSFDNTVKFLKHVFQGDSNPDNLIKGDPFTVALDYLTIQYQKPTQKLPVPILVSEENGTGKSTFLNWLNAIYGSNAVIMNNQQFAMSFNSHYVSKFIIGIDESFLEVEKKAEKERIKQLATAEKMMVQFKGADLKEIPYFGKLILCSNDADRIMKIDEVESRWFINKVPVVPKQDNDPELEEKMIKEIPAFLHYIKNREVFHPKTHRLWFDPEDFKTKQFDIIVQNTRTRMDKLIDSFIKDKFLTFKQASMKIPCKQLAELINKTAKFKLDDTDLNEYLKKKRMVPSMPSHYRFPAEWVPDHDTGFDPESEKVKIEYIKGVGRCYNFITDDWLSEQEMKEFSAEPEFNFEKPTPAKAPSQLDLDIGTAQKGKAEF